MAPSYCESLSWMTLFSQYQSNYNFSLWALYTTCMSQLEHSFAAQGTVVFFTEGEPCVVPVLIRNHWEVIFVMVSIL